jgi:hypothetical protein
VSFGAWRDDHMLLGFGEKKTTLLKNVPLITSTMFDVSWQIHVYLLLAACSG